ncbi:MAG: phenyltransferase domain-containing protein [Desulfobacterales bacterium]|nr:MAG: phenyltransferase domain-containing protein [Desulfobacterales bacterium]
MEVETSSGRREPDAVVEIEAVAALIAETQLVTGEIPWCQDQKTDPWDHVEAAMGLAVGGYLREAQKAYEWMADMQLEDGSWYAAYRRGKVEDRTRDGNLSAYIAVGVLHYYLITRDPAFLDRMWPTVAAAIDFALGLQAPEGEIYWAISPEGQVDPMALLTGSSSIYMSIKCALAIADLLGHSRPGWRRGLTKLEYAVRYKPFLFNMTKSRFAMDWFYPVLAGIWTGAAAQKRIDKFWKKFVVEEQGVRCVSDEPWVTIAETAELALALAAMGNLELARIIFNWIGDRKYEDGSYWCGFTCPDIIIWPEDKITWTNAVVLMAADAIYNLTPAAQLFSHRFWETAAFAPGTQSRPHPVRMRV